METKITKNKINLQITQIKEAPKTYLIAILTFIKVFKLVT